VRHLLIELWSRQASPLHRLDARVKLGALLVYLVALSTSPFTRPDVYAGFAVLLLAVTLTASLPPVALALRAAVVLPFSLTFAAVSWIGGDPQRAAALVVKSYLSSMAVLLMVSVTPLPKFMRGLESLGAPRFLLLVVQFLYRYLFVIVDQARGMRMAAASRASQSARGHRRHVFRAAAGALSVLFARSYRRAEGVHHAMLARAFQGHFPVLRTPRPGWRDAVFLAAALFASLGLRYAAGH